jgi:hypothetical protein
MTLPRNTASTQFLSRDTREFKRIVLWSAGDDLDHVEWCTDIHLPGKKIVLTTGLADTLEKMDIPSSIKKYLSRPTGNSYRQLTFLEDHSWCFIVDHPTSRDVHRDACDPVRFEKSNKEPVLGIINSVHPRNHKLFPLKPFLRQLPARSWDELRSVNEERCQVFIKRLGSSISGESRSRSGNLSAKCY